jgi:hypothetical protein
VEAIETGLRACEYIKSLGVVVAIVYINSEDIYFGRPKLI